MGDFLDDLFLDAGAEKSDLEIAVDGIASSLVSDHLDAVTAFAMATGRPLNETSASDNALAWASGALPGASEKYILSNPLPDELQNKLNIAAVDDDSHALRLIPKAMVTEEVCITAATRNSATLYYMSDEQKTDAVCTAAAHGHNPSLSNIPEEKRTPEICLAVLKSSLRPEPDQREVGFIPESFKAEVLEQHSAFRAQELDRMRQEKLLSTMDTGSSPEALSLQQKIDQFAQSMNTPPANPEESPSALHLPDQSLVSGVQGEAVGQTPAPAYELTPGEQESLRQEFREALDGINAIYRERKELSQEIDPASSEPAYAMEAPSVDLKAADGQELEQPAFNPMLAEHLEGFELRVNRREIFIDFKGVDADGNIQEYSLTEDQVKAMDDSPLKELVAGELQGASDKLEMLREVISLDAKKAEGINGIPIEKVEISRGQDYAPVATVRLAGSNEDMQIPLNPETLKPLREEHHALEHIIELSARQDHTPVPGNLDDAKIKAAELSELLDTPVRVVDCQAESAKFDGGSANSSGEGTLLSDANPPYGFVIEIGEGASKRKIHSMNMADLHRQLDKEIIKDRELSGVINVPRESFVTQHDRCVTPGQPEAHKPEEVDQEKKRSIGF